MRTITVHAGDGDLKVTLHVTHTDGQGLACFLYGGTLPHVGGQALASPGPKLHGEQLSRVDLWVATVPGHKDAEAAAAVARRLCLGTGEPVSVAAGIHVDDATPEQIQALTDACLEVADAALLSYPQEGVARQGGVGPRASARC
ncbi:hypothetical protein [Actinomyces glycerinitolerans]|uniref:Prenylated flavin chaperone LpdD-like domain-containing protein n=1 Tax=Actinomyces glycerinitolerans TaxID=1892869 RepID=A0A1M4RXZ2_9ACTO|nr:hypothetical protein [Actinomyces glycerinitolerans]SHE24770.1 Hypothetical protein ACGLYG10_0979 [Actinomyces glycerinitolerans]